jgi:pyrimidine-nucleoside phosphorylase
LTSGQHSIVELIGRKRDGHRLTAEELHWVILSCTQGMIPDYQMSAFLMAVLFQRMDVGELAAWTEAMLHSGDVVDLSHMASPKVDKHSTGGVGDKVSIPLAPIMAACGIVVPMISGRGLAHTCGTLDKLESIPGLRTSFSLNEFLEIVARTGLVFAGQSETLVPADRLIYALRDSTGTVPSVPLIASSIMSKKLSEGLEALILDIKVGSGAFMRTVSEAAEVAQTMIGLGAAHDTTVIAIYTAMDQPLGREVGNASEIVESTDALRGRGPPDLTEVVYKLGFEMLVAAAICSDAAQATRLMTAAVDSGRALEKFAEVIAAQDSDARVIEDTSTLPRARHIHHVRADRTGFIAGCDALAIGVAGVRLGGGRERKEHDVDLGVGISVRKKIGERVEAGDPVADVRFSSEVRLSAAVELLDRAWAITESTGEPGPLILGEAR